MHAMIERLPFPDQPDGALAPCRDAVVSRADNIHLAVHYAELLRAARQPAEIARVWRRLIQRTRKLAAEERADFTDAPLNPQCVIGTYAEGR